jgi:hypothetical protein
VYNGESFQLLQGVMDDFLAENLKGHAAVMP